MVRQLACRFTACEADAAGTPMPELVTPAENFGIRPDGALAHVVPRIDSSADAGAGRVINIEARKGLWIPRPRAPTPVLRRANFTPCRSALIFHQI